MHTYRKKHLKNVTAYIVFYDNGNGIVNDLFTVKTENEARAWTGFLNSGAAFARDALAPKLEPIRYGPTVPVLPEPRSITDPPDN